MLAVCLSLTACPGSLEDPDRFEEVEPPVPLCAGGVDPVDDILIPKCGDAVCHAAGAMPAGGLDVVTPGLADRLLDVPAIGCLDRTLVSTTSTAKSVLIDRVQDSPECGTRMPLLRPALTQAERTCLSAYVYDLVRTATSGADQ